jgi:hypothetical protein
MASRAVFPTTLHADSAEVIQNYFLSIPAVDTVLVVNSCARGQAVAESDLDFAILVKPQTGLAEKEKLGGDYINFLDNHPVIIKYKQASRFAHLHLDIIDGNYTPTVFEIGGASDYFEIEIGNQICYAVPLGSPGKYYTYLQHKWLPYYGEDLRLQRLAMTRDACDYDLEHIPLMIKRGLYFHAFDILIKAFQEYLQALFIYHRTYPIAYNKWIRYQVADLLRIPDLYPKLLHILSVRDIEGEEINEKARMLRKLLNDLQ